ncbi:MAG: YqiA/YcfP family alpha/beta fold hydrolase [Bacteroidota bacterium]
MKILYIHGLDSSPNPDRIGYMEEMGHEVVALHLDYREQPDAYHILDKYAREELIEGIVGSSLGGFLGFWLSQHLGVPCLLYNPAMWLDAVELKIPAPKKDACPQRYVVLGDEDDVVDPDQNWQFFSQAGKNQGLQSVIRCQGLGHQIDVRTFQDTFRWAGLGNS